MLSLKFNDFYLQKKLLDKNIKKDCFLVAKYQIEKKLEKPGKEEAK